MKERKFERGQAIAEMVIGLIAIMAVFLGLLFVAALGIENINVLISARSGADIYAASGTAGGDSGSAIIAWSSGDDEMYFTADDKAITGSEEATSTFSSQLQTTYSDASFNLAEPVTVGGTTYSTPFYNMSDLSLFLWAADLTGYTYTNSDPLASRNLTDLKQALHSLIGKSSDFPINEKVCMPMVIE